MSLPPLQSAAESLFADISAHKSPQALLSHFSTTDNVLLQHDYVHSPEPVAFTGLHAVRSYFDLLAMNWTRDDMKLHECTVISTESKVVMKANVRWTWRKSKRSWREEFTCTLHFDENKKVKGFVVKTDPPKASCVMHAVDKAQS